MKRWNFWSLDCKVHLLVRFFLSQRVMVLLFSPHRLPSKNIGIIFDHKLHMNCHVATICKSAFFQIWNISRIRTFLSIDCTKTLVHALVTCRLDFCNSLLYGLPKYLVHRLKLVQNCAARLILCGHKYDHNTPLLTELHSLPVDLLTFKALKNLGPSYISDLLEMYRPTRNLRSSERNLLVIPWSRVKSYGDHAFLGLCSQTLEYPSREY